MYLKFPATLPNRRRTSCFRRYLTSPLHSGGKVGHFKARYFMVLFRVPSISKYIICYAKLQLCPWHWYIIAQPWQTPWVTRGRGKEPGPLLAFASANSGLGNFERGSTGFHNKTSTVALNFVFNFVAHFATTCTTSVLRSKFHIHLRTRRKMILIFLQNLTELKKPIDT